MSCRVWLVSVRRYPCPSFRLSGLRFKNKRPFLVVCSASLPQHSQYSGFSNDGILKIQLERRTSLWSSNKRQHFLCERLWIQNQNRDPYRQLWNLKINSHLSNKKNTAWKVCILAHLFWYWYRFGTATSPRPPRRPGRIFTRYLENNKMVCKQIELGFFVSWNLSW
jgi:hypothetical protein